MPIKNYTTKIDCYQSIGEIQGALARNGARQIMISYDENGKPSGIAFSIITKFGMQGFILPANIDGVCRVLQEQNVKCEREHAEKVAWRNIRDWVLAQMAFIESGNVDMEEVFFPYLASKDGETTLYQAYNQGLLKLKEYND